jgi:hypothetical protein
MSSRSRKPRRRVIEEEDDEEDIEEEEEQLDYEDDEEASVSDSHARSAAKARPANDESDVEDESDVTHPESNIMLCSQIPEMSQSIRPARPAEINNFMKLGDEAREKAVMDLSRLVLFKALAGESIDRLKCAKDAGINDARMTSAVFAEVDRRLRNCFGFELKRIPSWMEKVKAMPKTYKDRYFVINSLKSDANGVHSKAILSVHDDLCVENALLLMVLAFAYCEGIPLVDGSRWIYDKDLYRLLHRLDENIPPDPPGPQDTRGTRRIESATSTPDVDILLEKFVHRDYLLLEKANEDMMAQRQVADENSVFYSMGPRAAMEIGRHQVLMMCSEILGVEPDREMLAEVQEEDEAADELTDACY